MKRLKKLLAVDASQPWKKRTAVRRRPKTRQQNPAPKTRRRKLLVTVA